MSQQLELWQFITARLKEGNSVMLLVVAESTGSSPGRRGYKMAVAENGELCGSIGGGVMEVRLVESAKAKLAGKNANAETELIEQVHRKNVPHSSGMICSGRQSVIMRLLNRDHLPVVEDILVSLAGRRAATIAISRDSIGVSAANESYTSETDVRYTERLGSSNELYIVGGGHCSLALSELMSRMDFRISIFDDRPDLNTIEKNEFADEITIVDTYENIGDHIPSGDSSYVVVMTLGYASDEVVVRSLIGKDLKYLGVLGSHAKMATLLKTLRDDGYPSERLDRIRTPIGVPINSHTPEEIAVSIAAEIVSIKNA
jgi:xanthine dehydrogenase accessory factor